MDSRARVASERRARDGRAPAPASPRRGTGTLDLALRVLEHLAHRSRSMSLGAIAKEFSASKATVYRHLQALVQQGFVHQVEQSGNYEIGIKLVVLGEAARGRFDIVRAGRDELIALRDKTQQAATVCGLVQDSPVVLDLIQGHTVIEFGTRPGTRLALETSAHGKVWLAFSEGAAFEQALARSHGAKPGLVQEITKIRRRGWATAPNEVIDGVNALAAPVFDHSARMIGSIAIVGATQFIAPEPARSQIDAVVGAARGISRALGWKGH
jgi:DNA-binding IclR family transcriptional regulator